jgi:hypothetical protein
MFRVEVVSSDGKNCGVPIQVDDHPGDARPYAINQIADSLLIRREEILAVFERGTAAELRAHLSKHTQEQLKPLRIRQEQVEARAFWQDESGSDN